MPSLDKKTKKFIKNISKKYKNYVAKDYPVSDSFSNIWLNWVISMEYTLKDVYCNDNLSSKEMIEYLLQDETIQDTEIWHISSNPNLTEKLIEKYIDMDWCWLSFLNNKSISIEFLFKHIKRWYTGYINEIAFYESDILTIDIIEQYSHWNYYLLSLNFNLTEKFVEDNIDKDWRWGPLLDRVNFSQQFFEKYLSYIPQECYCDMFEKPSITLDFLKKHFTLDQIITIDNGLYLSKNPSITIHDIKNNPQIQWDFSVLSQNKNISWEIISNHPEYDWDINEYCYNPNVTLKFIQNNIESISGSVLSDIINKFSWDFIEKNIDKFCASAIFRYEHLLPFMAEKMKDRFDIANFNFMYSPVLLANPMKTWRKLYETEQYKLALYSWKTGYFVHNNLFDINLLDLIIKFLV